MLHQIGSGVLGPVFRTYEPQRDRLVAVKAFRLDLVPEDVERLADSLKHLAGADLRAEGIVSVLDAGMEGTTAYLAMEYVAGETLDVAFRHLAPAPLERALPILERMARAIDAAWDAGFGHGALHPRDVFLRSGSDDVLITGFGVVPALESLGCRPQARRPYAAPERIAGDPPDLRADVYALGAIAYELLTRRRPAGPGEQDASAIGAASPEERERIHRVLSTALAVRPEDRFPDASAFVAALAEGASGADVAGSAAIFEGWQVEDETGRAAPAAAGRVIADDDQRAPDADEPVWRIEREPAVAAAAGASDEGEAEIAATAGDDADDRSASDELAGDDAGAGPVWRVEEDEPGEAVPDAAGSAASASDEPGAADEPAAEFADEVAPAEDLEIRPAAAVMETAPEGPPARVVPTPPKPAERRVPGPSASILAARAKTSRESRLPLDWEARLHDDGRGTGAGSDAVDSPEPSRDRRPLPPPMYPTSGGGDGRAPFPWGALAAAVVASLALGGVIGYGIGLRQSTPAPGEAGAGGAAATGTAAPAGATPEAMPPAVPPAVASAPPPTVSEPAGEPAASARPAPSSAPARTGRLTVRSVPTGATVAINGRQRGTTPLTLRDLPLGPLTVQVARRGYVTKSQPVELTATSPVMDITVRLAAPPAARQTTPPATPGRTGSVYVDSRPRGAVVYVDGRSVGRTPIRVGQLSAGSHAVRIELAGYRTVATSVTIRSGAEERLAVTLERSAPAPAGSDRGRR